QEPEQLVLVDEVAQVGAREAFARRADAALVERPRVARKTCVLQVQTSLPRQRGAGTPESRRPHAVEHVDAALDHVEDPFRVADAHEIPRLVRGEERRRPGGRLEHLWAIFTDREAAERVAVETEPGDLGDRAAPQFLVRVALRDPEQELSRRALLPELSFRPQGRA